MFSLECLVVKFLSYSKKGKLAKMMTRCYSLSLVVTRCTTRYHSLHHSLSLIVPLVVIRCHSLYHSLSLVVTRCTTRLSFYKRSVAKILTEGLLDKVCPCFHIVFAQLGVIPRTRNKFAEIATVAERYLIITHVKNYESKKQPSRICIPVILCLN